MLKTLPDESVHCCVTSPPYYGLRDYGIDGQLGLEASPLLYVERLVNIFRQVKRVLRSDGTLWLNLGDSYATGKAGRTDTQSRALIDGSARVGAGAIIQRSKPPDGLKSKDLLGIPWRVAFALQDDGWYLRQDIIWAKPNPMPESVKDRCTKSHEYIFLLSKSAKYFYDADAVMEYSLHAGKTIKTNGNKGMCQGFDGHRTRDGFKRGVTVKEKRNRRDVWTITTKPYSAAHFAVFPPTIPTLCIKAGCPEDGTVLDPFHGAGTTGLVALRLYREYIGIELNPEYVELSQRRIYNDSPLFNSLVMS